MKTRYLIFFLIFLLFAAVFTFLRIPISEGINTLLIAIGEGRSIRVDNTDMVKRKTEKQVKVKGGARISGAAQVRILPGKISIPPVQLLTEGKIDRRRRHAVFIPEWAVLGPFSLKAIPGKLNSTVILRQECMNRESEGVSFQLVPKEFEWKKIRSLSKDGRINLAEVFRKNKSPAAAWLVTEIEVNRDYPDARMLVGIQRHGRVFLNGELVFESNPKTPARADGSNVPVKLKKGLNRIIVKAASETPRSWFAFLRFTTAKKVPLMPPPVPATPSPSPAKTKSPPAAVKK